MNVELVNAFLAHQSESDVEVMLKQNIQQLNAELLKIESEKNETAKKLALVEQRYLKLLGAFENQLIIAEQLALSKGLEPLKSQQKEPEVSEQTETMPAAE